VRSSSSSVLVWPDRESVDRAVREWAASEARRHPEVRRLGYFGSYARGDWGVGSDVDLIAVVGHSDAPFERRALGWDTESLPVPAELLVYTEAEFAALCSERRRFARMLEQEAVWVLEARDAS
jgi:predicted nucleotidyltransferase